MATERLRIKRLKKDFECLQTEFTGLHDAFPDETNNLIWYFMLKCPTGTPYENGLYIGKITHSAEYPLKPSDFVMLTPSGRYSIGQSICLSFTKYHADQWSPVWNISGILTGFMSNMLEDGQTAQGIAYLSNTPEQRIVYANNSIEYNMANLKKIYLNFTKFVNPDGSAKSREEIQQYVETLNVKKTNAPKKESTVTPIEPNIEPNVEPNVEDDEEVPKICVKKLRGRPKKKQ